MEQEKLRVTDLTFVEFLGTGKRKIKHRKLFKARFKEREVALSIYDDSDPDTKGKLTTLKILMACRNHQGINSLLAAFVDVHIYFVYELCIGDFRQMLGKYVLKPQQAVTYALQLIDAVNFMHEKDIVHTDIRPSNCLLSTGGNLQLCNLELAMELDKECGFVKGTRMMGGAIGYAPIEVSRDGIYSTKSDAFSIGATLYFFFKRRHLFTNIIHVPEKIFDVEKTIKLLTQAPQTYLLERLKRENFPLPDLIQKLVAYDPTFRLSCKNITNDPNIWKMAKKINDNLYQENGWDVVADHIPKKICQNTAMSAYAVTSKLSSESDRNIYQETLKTFYFLDDSLKRSVGVSGSSNQNMGMFQVPSSTWLLDQIADKPPILPKKLQRKQPIRTLQSKSNHPNKAKSAKVLETKAKQQQQQKDKQEHQELPPRTIQCQEEDKKRKNMTQDTVTKRRIGEFHDAEGKCRVGQYHYETGHKYGESKICAMKYFANQNLNIPCPDDVIQDHSSIVKYNEYLKHGQIRYLIECVDEIYNVQKYEEKHKAKAKPILADPVLIGQLLSKRLIECLEKHFSSSCPFNYYQQLPSSPSRPADDDFVSNYTDVTGHFKFETASDKNNHQDMAGESKLQNKIDSEFEELKSPTTENEVNQFKQASKTTNTKTKPNRYRLSDLDTKLHDTIFREVCGRFFHEQWLRCKNVTLTIEDGCSLIPGQSLTEEILDELLILVTTDENKKSRTATSFTTTASRMLLAKCPQGVSNDEWIDIILQDNKEVIEMIKNAISEGKDYLLFPTIVSKEPNLHYILLVADVKLKSIQIGDPCNPSGTLKDFEFTGQTEIKSAVELDLNAQVSNEMLANVKTLRTILSKIESEKLNETEKQWTYTDEFLDVGLEPQRDSNSCGAIVVQIAETLIGRELYRSELERQLLESYKILTPNWYGGLRIRLMYELIETYETE